MYRRESEERVRVEGDFCTQTPKAYLVRKGRGFTAQWIPKSKCWDVSISDGGHFSALIPKTLAAQKGLA